MGSSDGQARPMLPSGVTAGDLWQTSPDALLVVGAGGAIAAANPAAHELFGYEPGDLPGRSDSAMGAATRGVLGSDQLCVTLEIHVRYLRPVFGGSVEVRARVLNPGRRIVQLEATAANDGTPVAHATGSFVVLDRAPGTGDPA